MKRRWNFALWTGFLLVLTGLVSYVPLFALFPITRDFPWVNLLLFLAGGILMATGLKRAFAQPELYRGKIIASILAGLSGVGVGLFLFGLFFLARQLPSAAEAPRVGQKVPDFNLADQNDKPVALAELLSPQSTGSASARANGALLIFYRGHW